MTENGIAHLIDDYLDGELDDAGGVRLRAWLEADPANVRAFVRQVFLHQQLREGLLAQNVGHSLQDSTVTLAELPADRANRDCKLSVSKWSYFSAAVLLVIGGFLGSWITSQLASPDSARDRMSVVARTGTRESPPAPWATLVNLTNCRWDSEGGPAIWRAGSRVSPGQSLNLLEGIAEISTSIPSGGTGRFQLEGPLAMMLKDQGMPSVQFGKLAAQISCDLDSFTLDTPLGWAIVPDEASIGLDVAVNQVELHVFAGEATFEPLWPINVSRDLATLNVKSGTSLRLSVGGNGNLVADRGTADENRFVTRVSMAASRLNITDRYVDEIRQAKPLAYWRFESNQNGVIPNEMGDDLACHIYGEGVHLRSYNGNHAAEFGATSGYGYLMSGDAVEDKIGNDYSVEAWIKPSHFHHGACFLLVDAKPKVDKPPVLAGLSLQLRGPSNRLRMPGPSRIRFTHRNPPADAGGTTCLSSTAYEPRRWQHVVGVKQGPRMRLYLNGQVAATGKNTTELANGMRVLMGQLHPYDPTRAVVVRPFVGEMDEVALYDRALSKKEIDRHYKLGRPAAEPPDDEMMLDL